MAQHICSEGVGHISLIINRTHNTSDERASLKFSAVARGDRHLELRARAVFGAHAAPLVELAQVVLVVPEGTRVLY